MIVEEKFEDIENYENRYQISNFGNVFLKTKQKYCNLSRHPKGYLCIKLYGNDGSEKMFTVHRLVAKAFIPNIENKCCVNHKDGDKKNNHVDNLEWCARAENSKHASENNLVSNGVDRWNAKLDEDKVREIRKLSSEGMYQKDIGRLFDIGQGMVSDIVNRKIWKQVK